MVEPKYGKKLETLDDLLDSDVVYGYGTAFSFIMELNSYSQFLNFLEHKKHKVDCSDIRKCVERMITKRDIAIVIPPIFVTYCVGEIGKENVGKIICSLEQVAGSAVLKIYFKKGNPLLDKFNILIRRFLEAGFLENFWTEQQHHTFLSGGGRFGKAVSDIYFAFSVSHLMPAFVVLLVGTVLSSVVFIVELTVNCL
jgi:hypothetical protein